MRRLLTKKKMSWMLWLLLVTPIPGLTAQADSLLAKREEALWSQCSWDNRTQWVQAHDQLQDIYEKWLKKTGAAKRFRDSASRNGREANIGKTLFLLSVPKNWVNRGAYADCYLQWKKVLRLLRKNKKSDFETEQSKWQSCIDAHYLGMKPPLVRKLQSCLKKMAQ